MQQQASTPETMRINTARISACEKGRQPQPALELFAAMQQQAMAPIAAIHTTHICACEKGDQP